jgi:hypothetical protein
METARMPGRCGAKQWNLGPALIVVAIVVRAAAVLVLQSHMVPHSTFEHGEIAANLIAGRGFAVRFLGVEGPTAQQAPVYPLLVTVAYWLGGVGTPRALLILELGQALLGGLLVAAVLALGRTVAPDRPRIATFAALTAALHPSLVYAATHVQVASLATTLLIASLAAAVRAGETGRDGNALCAGLLLGLLTLTDPILALVAPGMAWAVVLRQGVRRAVRPMTVMALVSVLVVAPWIVRNTRVHGEFVAIKSTFGYAFWQGNCAVSQGTDKVVRPSVEQILAQAHVQPMRDLRGWNASLWAARHAAGYIDDIALTPDDYRELAQLSEPERSRRLFHRALRDLRSDPSRYPQLCLRRLRYFVLFDETNPKTRNIVYRASHFALTFLALAGLLRARREVRKRLAPTILTAVLITAFHSLTIVSARFHIPIEPLLGLWAAAGFTPGRDHEPRHQLRPQPRLLATSNASASIWDLPSRP